MSHHKQRSRIRRLATLFLDYVVYLIVRVTICVVQTAPREMCERGATLLAWVFSDLLRVRAVVVDDNLQHAFPEMAPRERLTLRRGMWEHLFLLVVEVTQAPRKIHQTNWRDYLQLANPELIVRALFEDRPLVLLSGHYGNFELCNYILGVLGFRTYAIARPLDNGFLNAFINRFRGASGQRIIPKDGCAPLVDVLMAQHGAMGFLVDTHAGPKGCHVEFFGRPVSTHKAIAVFAIAYQAPMVMCFGRRQGRLLHHRLGAIRRSIRANSKVARRPRRR